MKHVYIIHLYLHVYHVSYSVNIVTHAFMCGYSYSAYILIRRHELVQNLISSSMKRSGRTIQQIGPRNSPMLLQRQPKGMVSKLSSPVLLKKYVHSHFNRHYPL